ncbi:hypothetical protein [Tellurirhabdus rosea]|uniref:hypothetical protein n=1 Tax=Tellurirhabdus rosea TaxID=2674997 RepID=UPI0022571BEE|nr:hypothetical protein [Tellurirhabdus rosea]
MKECSIYYPGFLPCLNWTKASLLYNDELLSVFPTDEYLTQLLEGEEPEATENRQQKNYFKRAEAIRFLYENELFTPIVAKSFINKELKKELGKEYRRLEKGFKKDGSSALLPQLFDRFSPPVLQSVPLSAAYETSFFDYVYAINRLEKPEVAYEVEHNDLIDQSVWFLTRLVREDFMLKGKHITPGTCNAAFQDFLFQAQARPTDAVTLIFDTCFPVPQANTNLEAILAYKEKYKEHLNTVRQYLRSFEYDLATVFQTEGVGELLLELETNIFAVLREISRSLKREGINIQTASYHTTLSMERSPNLAAFEKVKQMHGSIVFSAQGTRRRAVRLLRTNVAGLPSDSRKLGQYTLGSLFLF